jgi:Skp family chaperone for outer membrane proteins
MTPTTSARRGEVTELLRHMVAAGALAALVLSNQAQAQVTRQAQRSVSSMRVAVFDSRVVLDSMPERSAAESEFALERAKARTMLKAATDSLRAALDEFVQFEAQLSPRQREATTMHLRARELLVEEMAANLDHVILQRQAELQHPLRERVRVAVRAVRQRAGYDLVLDRANDQVIFDADESADITADVLRELRGQKQLARVPNDR